MVVYGFNKIGLPTQVQKQTFNCITLQALMFLQWTHDFKHTLLYSITCVAVRVGFLDLVVELQVVQKGAVSLYKVPPSKGHCNFSHHTFGAVL